MPSSSPAESLEQSPLNKFHKRLAFYSGGGAFLDGYILSIVGVALIQATVRLRLSTSWQGLIGASALIGMFFGGFIGGWLTDKFGRQILYTLDLIVIALCSVAQFWVESAMSLFLLRLLIGAAVGADYPIASSLLAEFAPKRSRGPLLGGLIAMWFAGAAVAYIVGELLHRTGPDGWRAMLVSPAIPAMAFVIMRHGAPESPRWLTQKGRFAEADAVMKRVYGEEATYLPPLGYEDEKIHIRLLLRPGYGTRMLFITTFWTCSVIPVFAVYAFGPKILGTLGLSGTMSILGTVFITLLFLVGCVVSLFVINRLGRRMLALHSFLWSSLALLLLAFFHDRSPMMILVLSSAYAISTGGTQILQWVYPNELFPTKIRGTAVGLASSLSRIGAATGTYLVPVSLDTLGIRVTMFIAAGITLLGFAICLRAAPETRTLDLDECAVL
jgi:MFS transporter, putative metabolite transport protein